jgi:hypothetical protein
MRERDSAGNGAARAVPKSFGLAPPLPPSVASPWGWTMGPDGPALSDMFAANILQLKPRQRGEVDRVLQENRRAYLEALVALSARHVNDAGHWLVEINLSPQQIEQVENQLWSELDQILTPPQEAIARNNLQLDQGNFFPWKSGAKIEIWRVGKWFHWTVSTPSSFAAERRAPELPAELRFFWKDPLRDGAAPTERSAQPQSASPSKPRS